MKIRNTASQLAVAATIAIALPAAARAQDAQAVPQADEADQGGIQDIVVTAQRREESLQNVPISVTAVTADGLRNAGATNTLDLGSVTPGLQMNTQRSTVTPYLRGVGTENGGVGEEGSIAAYIDGVYVTALSGANLSFNNIERVEVLKGPQGTLFGRNATGGLIQIVTRKPSHDTMVDAEASYANYQTITGNVYATTGITDKLAVDFAGFVTDQGKGWGKNDSGIPGVNGQDINYRNEWAVRSSALFEPTETLSFRLAGDYNHRNSDIGNVRVIVPGTKSIIGTPFDGQYYGSNSELPRDVDFHQWGVSLVSELALGDAKLRSTTAYRDVTNFTLFDQDSTQAGLVKATLGENTKSFQQEVIVLGDVGRLNYTAGLFYFHSKALFQPFNIRSIVPSSNFNQFGRMGTDSYAAFAQGTYKLTDTTNLTAGLRFTRDERDIAGQRTAAPGNPLPLGTVLLDSADNNNPAQRATPFSNNAHFNKLTWRFGIDQHVADHVLLYANYSRGFKSGIYNLSNPFSPPARPETLDAYEAGIKSDFLDRTLRVNLSGFYYDYKDIQLSRIVATSTEIYNAAKARVIGLDGEIIVAPPVQHGDLQFRAAFTLLDSKYTKFDTATLYVPSGVGGNIALVNQDVSGNQLRFAPPVTINLSTNYGIPVGDGKLNFNVNYLFNSGFYWEPGNRRDIKQKSYDLLNGRLGYTSDKGWRVAVFANNITNARYLTQLTATSLGDQGSYAAPRTYGVSLGYKFGR